MLMVVIEDGIVKEERLVQPINVPVGITVSALGSAIVTVSSADEPLKTWVPISFTEAGMETLASDVHPINVLPPMDLVPEGKQMDPKLLQF